MGVHCINVLCPPLGFFINLPQTFTTNATTVVLQSNFGKCTISNAENTPPSVLPKSLTSCLLSNTQWCHAHTNGHGNSSKYAAEQTACCSHKQKQPTRQLKFKMLSIPTPKIKMADATLGASSLLSNTVPIMLPKELGCPEYLVMHEALVASASGFANADASYIHEGLECFGPSALKSLACICPQSVPERLPSEIDIKLQPIDGFSPMNPTHMWAIFSPPPSPSTSLMPAKKHKVTLYPVHSAYLAAHCTCLPPFSPTIENNAAPRTSFKVPVRSLCLPSPATYSCLSSFLYTKNANTLLSSMLPVPPASPLISSLPSADGTSAEHLLHAEHWKNIMSYVCQIASTYIVNRNGYCDPCR
ncbi:hypothetical protein DXG01_008302 [Tephrocybe rancida]|nr:hypothetical protein DXG01_008302 [Tephrocybe rancida]